MKRATLLSVAAPLLLVLVPLHALVIGIAAALVHGVWGALVALLLLEGTMLGFRKLPFASAYVPTGQLKTLGLPLVMMALAAAYGLAWIERLALTSRSTLACLVVLAMLVGGVHGIDAWQRRTRTAMDLDEAPSPATQRLELSE